MKQNGNKIKAAYAAYILPILLILLAASTEAVLAATGDEEAKVMFAVFNDMADFYIAFAYGAMILIFVIGMVKSGISAQIAKQFGAASKVSAEMINIIGSIVILAFGILSFPIAKEIIKNTTDNTGIAKAPTVDNLQIPGL